MSGRLLMAHRSPLPSGQHIWTKHMSCSFTYTYFFPIGLAPLCENMPSGKANKPGDVVTAKNGKTIQVCNWHSPPHSGIPKRIPEQPHKHTLMGREHGLHVGEGGVFIASSFSCRIQIHRNLKTVSLLYCPYFLYAVYTNRHGFAASPAEHAKQYTCRLFSEYNCAARSAPSIGVRV